MVMHQYATEITRTVETYCYVIVSLQMGFGLMIGFTGLSIQHVTTFYSSLLHTLVSTVTSSLAVAWQRLPTVDIPLPPSSQTIPGLSYQLLTATPHD
jgi:hypothetical protein